MDIAMSMIKKYYLYTKERFPIPATLLYASAMFYLSYFFPNALTGHGPVAVVDSLLGCLVIFMVLFEIRILDEHKDYKYDVIAYPERLLSRGVITLQELRRVLWVLLALQLVTSLYLGIVPFLVWVLIQIYSLLMFREFFAPEFLKERIGLYLLSHQLSVPVVFLFGISMRIGRGDLSSIDPVAASAFLFGGMMATINFEIARKTWSPDREHEQADSYTRVWGIGRTVLVNQAVALAAGAAFVYLYVTLARPAQYAIIIAAVYLVFFVSEILFLMKRDAKSSKIVESAGALYSLAVLITSAVCFSLI